MTELLWTLGPADAAPPRGTLLLAHGAGAPMDSAFMNRMAEALAAEGIAVARFEFPYMADRRTTGKKKPPPSADTLLGAYRRAIASCLADERAVDPILIGGKSMGGRVAAMVGGEVLDPRVRGIVCLGYPFHPPGRPEAPRLAPLRAVRLPTLILQGERDEFGDIGEVEAYGLADPVRIVPIEDGSHDFGPRGSSAATLKGNILFAAAEIAAFAAGLGPVAGGAEPTSPAPTDASP